MRAHSRTRTNTYALLVSRSHSFDSNQQHVPPARGVNSNARFIFDSAQRLGNTNYPTSYDLRSKWARAHLLAQRAKC